MRTPNILLAIDLGKPCLKLRFDEEETKEYLQSLVKNSVGRAFSDEEIDEALTYLYKQEPVKVGLLDVMNDDPQIFLELFNETQGIQWSSINKRKGYFELFTVFADIFMVEQMTFEEARRLLENKLNN